MTHPGLVDIVIGCVIFFAFIVWIVAELLLISRWFGRVVAAILNPQPTHVHQTMNEMYGDVHIGERDYQGTRHAAVEIDKGGSRARER